DRAGHETRAAVAADLDRLGRVDLVLLAGDTTDRNDLEGSGTVLQPIRTRVSARIAAVFGNNEYADDHPAYVARFAGTHRVRFLQDEAERWSVGGRVVRGIGRVGWLDRVAWWVGKNLPHLAEAYRRRSGLRGGVVAGDDLR